MGRWPALLLPSELVSRAPLAAQRSACRRRSRTSSPGAGSSSTTPVIMNSRVCRSAGVSIGSCKADAATQPTHTQRRSSARADFERARQQPSCSHPAHDRTTHVGTGRHQMTQDDTQYWDPCVARATLGSGGREAVGVRVSPLARSRQGRRAPPVARTPPGHRCPSTRRSARPHRSSRSRPPRRAPTSPSPRTCR